MSHEADSSLIDQFKKLLEDPAPPGRQKEQVVQDFLEENSVLIPTPNLLNHQLHFELIISKFPLGTELTTDYVYMTKSSDVWRIILVELEAPEKNIFTNDMKKPNPSADFNTALNQVRGWKLFIKENESEVIRRLDPLLKPDGMRGNPIEFSYELIIGRSQNKNFSGARKKYIRNLIKETEIDILTYDTLINWYMNSQLFVKNILRLSGSQYIFKHMHKEPTQILAFLGPDVLGFSNEQFDQLKKLEYEMDRWKNGELLTYNAKYVNSPWKKERKSGSIFDPSQA